MQFPKILACTSKGRERGGEEVIQDKLNLSRYHGGRINPAPEHTDSGPGFAETHVLALSPCSPRSLIYYRVHIFARHQV